MTWQNQYTQIGAMGLGQEQVFKQVHPLQHAANTAVQRVTYSEGATIKLPLKAAEAMNRMKLAAAGYRDLALAAEQEALAEDQLSAQIEDELRKGREVCDMAKVGLLVYERSKHESNFATYDKKNKAAADYWSALTAFQDALLEAGTLPKIDIK